MAAHTEGRANGEDGQTEDGRGGHVTLSTD